MKLLVLILIVTISLMPSYTEAIAVPRINFEMSLWLDRYMCPKEAKNRVTLDWANEAAEKLPSLIKFWNERGPELLEGAISLTERPFNYKRKTVMNSSEY